jgi:lincosamide nucleotidyltransferase A/C/D/E
MAAEQVLEILEVLDTLGVEYWLAGGWGVDAVVGSQTRSHDDLDIILEDFSVCAPVVSAALKEMGFRVVERSHRETWMPDQWLLKDEGTRRVDLVSLDWDRLTAGLKAEGALVSQTAEGVTGVTFTEGRIGSRVVPCLSALAQRLFRSDFEHRSIDRLDLAQLESAD